MFPSSLGIFITYDMSREVGSRVVEAMVRCSHCLIPRYEPLDSAATYGVLCNSYILNGGDGYHAFKKYLQRYNYREYFIRFKHISTNKQIAATYKPDLI